LDTEGSSSKGLTEVDLSLIGRARVLHSETRAGVEVDDLLDEREACRNHGLEEKEERRSALEGRRRRSEFAHLRRDQTSKNGEEEGDPVERTSNTSRDRCVEDGAQDRLAIGDDPEKNEKLSSQSTNDERKGRFDEPSSLTKISKDETRVDEDETSSDRGRSELTD